MLALRQAVLPLFLSAVLLVPATARADSATRNPFSAVPVGGISPDGNAFQGTMEILGFINDNGLKAIGSLTGTITPANGAVQQVAGAIVLVPVKTPPLADAQQGFGGPDLENSRFIRTAAPSAQQATCPILHLDLGPLDLNLLGLAVHLNEVVLDITAIPGAGNLLGNLLCAIAGLLNGPSITAALTNVLTQLLNNLAAAIAAL